MRQLTYDKVLDLAGLDWKSHLKNLNSHYDAVVRDHLKPRLNAKTNFLDVGCGSRFIHFPLFLESGSRYTGLDEDYDQIELFRQNYEHYFEHVDINIRLGSFEDFEINEAFDFVYMGTVLNSIHCAHCIGLDSLQSLRKDLMTGVDQVTGKMLLIAEEDFRTVSILNNLKLNRFVKESISALVDHYGFSTAPDAMAEMVGPESDLSYIIYPAEYEDRKDFVISLLVWLAMYFPDKAIKWIKVVNKAKSIVVQRPTVVTLQKG